MEEMNNKVCSKSSCDCSMCNMHHHRVIRMIFAVFIVMFAFWMGMRLGEMKGYIMADNYNSARGQMMYNQNDRVLVPVYGTMGTTPTPTTQE